MDEKLGGGIGSGKKSSNDPTTPLGKLAVEALKDEGFADMIKGMGYRPHEVPWEAVAYLGSRWANKKLGVPVKERPAIDALMPQFEALLMEHAGKEDNGSGLSINAYFAHDIHNRRAQGILNRSLKAVRGMSSAARRDLSKALEWGTSSGEAILNFVDKYRIQLARILTATQMAALLEGAQEVAAKVPALGSVPIEGLPIIEQERIIEARLTPPTFTAPTPPAGTPEEVHFPIIDEAVKNLAQRQVMGRAEYDALDAAARAKAFTVANVSAEETLTKIRDSLAENVREGADYNTWKKKVMEDVNSGTFLSDAHQETVFRTNVQTGFSDGQATVLGHPLVRSGFPYSTYDAIHDDRAREDHLALEEHGIGGSNVYRNDDPVFQMFRPPWDYNDRCGWTPITVRQAAERGIAEARQWLETGIEPKEKSHVEMPPFEPPPGFRRALTAAPLSIQLSMQSIATFATNQPRDKDGKWKNTNTSYSITPEESELSIAEKLNLPTAYHGDQAHDEDQRRLYKIKTNVVVDNPLPKTAQPSYLVDFSSEYMDEIGHRTISIDEIVTSQDWIRPTTIEARINGYRPTDDDDEEELPIVMELNGEKILVDGNHSVLAAKINGNNTIKVNYNVVTQESLDEMQRYIKNRPQVAKELGFPATFSIEPDKNQLTAEILVAMFGDEVEAVAEWMANNEGEEIDAELSIMLAIPKVTRRYGKRPGPGWIPGGVSSKGVQIWLYGASAPSAPATLPIPVSPAPTLPIVSPPPIAPAPAPIPSPAAPAMPPFPGTSAPPGGKRPSNNAVAAGTHAAAMARIQAGQALTPSEKTTLTRRLNMMSLGQLTSLHAALGGPGTGLAKPGLVSSVTNILAGAASTPPPVVPPPASPTPPAPTPPPVAPVSVPTPTTKLGTGRNVIAGTIPAYYIPPAPKLVAAGPYGGAASNSGALPTTIDHTIVGSFPKDINSVPSDFTKMPLINSDAIATYSHKTSGYVVRASWTYYGVPAPGQPAKYSITVFDGAGQIVSTYDSSASRDETYIKERVAQTLNWLDSELAKAAKPKSAITAPIAQFAHIRCHRYYRRGYR